MTTTAFSSLPLPADLLDNLESLGYREMTPIQAASLPLMLAGSDVIAQAKTGSGKTAAFGLGLLARLNVRHFAVQALVLCPTRELADQVAGELRRLARCRHNVKVLTLCGGMPIGPQIASLEHGAHILVGTPGRLLDHLRKSTLDLCHVNQVVLDEADRMLDMGFADAVETLMAACNPQRQTLLFSATYPEEIQSISARYQREPVRVTVDTVHNDQQIAQHFFSLQEGADKSAAILQLLRQFQPNSAIIFCNTKQDCAQLSQQLQTQGVIALALHGDLEQKERDQVLVRFANGSCRILVATDVAARGLDIKSLELVINADVVHDPEVHIHRIGRSGRAGEQGLAITLVTLKDTPRLNRLEDYLGETITLEPLTINVTVPHMNGTKSATRKAPSENRDFRWMPEMVTLCIDGGKKDKLRPADVLGALTKDAGLAGDDIGKIHIFDLITYVAVKQFVAKQALTHLQHGKLKGRKFRARAIS